MTTDPKARITELEAENAALREQLELLASEDCFKGDKQRLALPATPPHAGYLFLGTSIWSLSPHMGLSGQRSLKGNAWGFSSCCSSLAGSPFGDSLVVSIGIGQPPFRLSFC
jgi:hypothetical protein